MNLFPGLSTISAAIDVAEWAAIVLGAPLGLGALALASDRAFATWGRTPSRA